MFVSVGRSRSLALLLSDCGSGDSDRSDLIHSVVNPGGVKGTMTIVIGNITQCKYVPSAQIKSLALPPHTEHIPGGCIVPSWFTELIKKLSKECFN